MPSPPTIMISRFAAEAACCCFPEQQLPPPVFLGCSRSRATCIRLIMASCLTPFLQSLPNFLKLMELWSSSADAQVTFRNL